MILRCVRQRVHLFGLFLLLTSPAPLSAQLVVTPLGVEPPSSLVDTLLGPGISVSNIQFQGDTEMAGFFSGGAGILGFEEGILLSSGYAVSVVGPNLWDGTTGAFSVAGDTDLDGLTSSETYDACVLEFDFVPSSDTITFEYVFGSEEYNEYVFEYNDVFAFFVNGVNVALIPGSSDYVSIDNVNLAVNPSYYRNNENPDATIDTELDGLTTVLGVNAHVNVGEVNHIKLAVADVLDYSLDSVVFLRAYSFSVPTPTPTPYLVPGPVPEIHVWPIPFIPSEAVGGTLKAAELPFGASMVFYTVSGEKVAELVEKDGRIEWDGRNGEGRRVSSGTYYYVIRSGTRILMKGKLVLVDR